MHDSNNLTPSPGGRGQGEGDKRDPPAKADSDSILPDNALVPYFALILPSTFGATGALAAM